jgi:hypothetical protein
MKDTFTVTLNKYNDFSEERLKEYIQNNKDCSFKITLEKFNSNTRNSCFDIIKKIADLDVNAKIKVKLDAVTAAHDAKLDFIQNISKYKNVTGTEFYRGTLDKRNLTTISENQNLDTLSLYEIKPDNFTQKDVIEILSNSNIKNLTCVLKNRYDIIPFKLDNETTILLRNSKIKNITTALDTEEIKLPENISFHALNLQYNPKVVSHKGNNQLINNSNEFIKESLKRKRKDEKTISDKKSKEKIFFDEESNDISFEEKEHNFFTQKIDFFDEEQTVFDNQNDIEDPSLINNFNEEENKEDFDINILFTINGSKHSNEPYNRETFTNITRDEELEEILSNILPTTDSFFKTVLYENYWQNLVKKKNNNDDINKSI